MNPKNKLAEMPIRPLLYTMAVPLMLSLLIQSLYNIVDSIFVARLSETALTAASLVYAIQFLMIAIGVGTAVGLNALLSRKLGQKKPEEACRAAWRCSSCSRRSCWGCSLPVTRCWPLACPLCASSR